MSAASLLTPATPAGPQLYVNSVVASGDVSAASLTLPSAAGRATLVNGTLPILTTAVTASSSIQLTPYLVGGAVALSAGGLAVTAVVPGVSFTVTAVDLLGAIDAAILAPFSWAIIN